MEEFIHTGTRSTNGGGALDRLRGAPERLHLMLLPQRFQSDGELLIATLADVLIMAVRSQAVQKCVMSSETSR
jgi:hypothetical protein